MVGTPPRQVLLIDNDLSQTHFIQEMLGGCEDSLVLASATQLDAGLRLLEQQPFDCVMLGLPVHGMGASTAIAAVIQHVSDIPLLVLGDEATSAEEARTYGAAAYLVKQRLTRELLGQAIRHTIERTHQEKALRLSEDRFAKTLAAAEAVILELELKKGSVSWHGPVLKVLGRPPLILGQTLDVLRSFIHAEDRETFPRLDDTAGKGIPPSEFRIIWPDRTVRWLQIRWETRRGVSGTATHVIGFVQDISDRRQMESELDHAQRMAVLGRLVAGVAHDFNNILTVVNGFSDLTLRKLPPDNPFREAVSEIRMAGERGSLLTKQLLGFSRRTLVAPVSVNLNQLIAEMSKMLRRLIGEDIHLVVIPEAEPTLVHADPCHLTQVIMNLTVNARDAMDQGGTITVQAENSRVDESGVHTTTGLPAGEYVVLTVSDTGCGMDAATRARIFEPFFTTKGQALRTGLGLATIQEIISQMGGVIEVESQLNVGTTFRLFLPRLRKKLAVKQAPGTAILQGRETILVVEDEEPVRRLTSSILTASGYTVLEAGSGDEALHTFQASSNRIQMLLTDIIMQGMNGVQLAEKLCALKPGLRVLYITGYTANALKRNGVVEEVPCIMEKPFTPSSLTTKVREVLDQAVLQK